MDYQSVRMKNKIVADIVFLNIPVFKEMTVREISYSDSH